MSFFFMRQCDEQIQCKMDKFRNPDAPYVGKLDGRIGETIRKYKIVFKLGEGGNCIVYHVKDNQSRTSYAQKISQEDLCGKDGRQMKKKIAVLKIEYYDFKNKTPILKTILKTIENCA